METQVSREEVERRIVGMDVPWLRENMARCAFLLENDIPAHDGWLQVYWNAEGEKISASSQPGEVVMDGISRSVVFMPAHVTFPLSRELRIGLEDMISFNTAYKFSRQ